MEEAAIPSIPSSLPFPFRTLPSVLSPFPSLFFPFPSHPLEVGP